MKRKFSSLALLVAASLVGGCGGGEPQEEAPAQEPAPAEQAVPADSPLLTPANLTETAPETYQVRFETSVGPIVVQVNRAWSPNGADRFYNLVKNGYYDDTRFYRVVEGFMAQFGFKGVPAIDEPARQIASAFATGRYGRESLAEEVGLDSEQAWLRIRNRLAAQALGRLNPLAGGA